MKVKELIARLQQEDPEALVVCQSDGEGNSYSPLADVAGSAEGFLEGYVADSTWSGDRRYRKLTPELEAEGYGEDDVDETAEAAVFLQPVN